MKWVVFGFLLVAAAAAWMIVNPVKGFGVSGRGLTTYDMVPIPVVDLQVNAAGSVRLQARRVREMSLDELAWLIADKPDVLIVATGWGGRLAVKPEVTKFLQGYDVRVMKTGEALDLYNRLEDEGKRVAVHVRAGD